MIPDVDYVPAKGAQVCEHCKFAPHPGCDGAGTVDVGSGFRKCPNTDVVERAEYLQKVQSVAGK